MAKVSLSQAAKDTGVSLPTLSRWRKNGKISAEKTGSGGYMIDTSEYDRIQELRKQSPNMKGVTKPSMKTTEIRNDTPSEMKVLQVEVEVLRERMKDKSQMIDDLKEDRDEWKKQAQTLLLQSHSVTEKPQEAHSENIGVSPKGPLDNAPPGKNLELYGVYFLLLLALSGLGILFWQATEKNSKEVEATVSEPDTYSAEKLPTPHPLLNLPRMDQPQNSPIPPNYLTR